MKQRKKNVTKSAIKAQGMLETIKINWVCSPIRYLNLKILLVKRKKRIYLYQNVGYSSGIFQAKQILR